MHGEFLLGRRDRVTLQLTKDALVWSHGVNAIKPERQLPLNEILSVTMESCKERCCFRRGAWQFCVHSFERNKKRMALWKPVTFRFTTSSSASVQQWMSRIQKLLKEQTERPKRLWTFVNPYGGSRKALRIWRHKVR